jgi:hypothetical protein
MAGDPFIDEDSRVLTPEVFAFVLNNELKRAVRSQNFLTLLVLEPTAQPPAPPVEGNRATRQVARIVSREVRETDLFSADDSTVSVVLLDADLQSALGVVDRLVSRFEHYEFPTPLSIEVGAACCPTHGADADSLRRAAEARPVHRRDQRGTASNAQ